MKLKSLIILAFALTVSTAAVAQLGVVQVALSEGGSILNNDGTALVDGTVAQFGLFDETSYDSLGVLQTNFSSVDALFTPIGSLSSTGGSITGGFAPSTGTAGDKIFVWVANNSDFSLATEWGIWSSSAPTFNLTNPPGFSVIAGTNINNFVAAEGSTLKMALVPEPAHFAALFGFLALGFVLWRRR